MPKLILAILIAFVLSSSAFANPYDDSPFGIFVADNYSAGYSKPPYYDAVNIGTHWTRTGSLFAYWNFIEPNPLTDPPTYHWAQFDAAVAAAPNTVRLMGNIFTGSYLYFARDQTDSYLPLDEVRYRKFVRALVERYDGDGVLDMPGLTNPIKFWQVDNEPDNRPPPVGRTDYADLLRIAYEEIKAADPTSAVVIGGATGGGPTAIHQWRANYNNKFKTILDELAGQYVDVMDVHWYGARDDSYRMIDQDFPSESLLPYVRATMNAAGFSPTIPIWMTEQSSVSGWPLPPSTPRSEVDQARDLFKKFVYLQKLGASRIFVAKMFDGLLQDDGYFDHDGLIYDGLQSFDLGAGVPKLAYFTYKLMSEKLSNADWSTLTTLRDGTGSDHLYLFTLQREGVPVWIAWWDYFDESHYVPGSTKSLTVPSVATPTVEVTQAVPSASSGSLITDYASAFGSVVQATSGGSATISLNEFPVMIEGSARACGNGVIEGGEACDDGNATDGDGCDLDCQPTLCRAGSAISKVNLAISNLGGVVGDETLTIQGTVTLPPGSPFDIGLGVLGAQVYVAGLGVLPTIPLDLSIHQQAIPAGERGSGCNPLRDGWRVSRSRADYRNASNALPPTCAAGSAKGLKLLSLSERTGRTGHAVKIRLQATGVSIPATGLADNAIRMTIVFGADAAAGNAGNCAMATIVNCARSTLGSRLRCRTN